MLKYTLEEKKLPSLSYRCEVCGKKPAKAGVKEFYKDGTVKIHHSCSNHIIDLYNKIEIENKKRSI